MQEAEKVRVRALIKRFLAEGYAISVDDGDDGYFVRGSTNYDEIVKELFSMDEDKIYARKEGWPSGMVWCIYGNSPEEVFADYSMSIASIVEKE